ncbi:hypothetical protein ABIC17_002122, partial [Sphingomonas sp. PvP056]
YMWLPAWGGGGLGRCGGFGYFVFFPETPLPFWGGVGGGPVPASDDVSAGLPHPNPSPEGEGLEEVRMPFLRQQIAKREGRANMCLTDFIDPAGDWIGGFAVTTGHGIDAHLKRFKADNDDYSDILLKALADRLAEAFAERLHQHVRTTLWGYAEGEQLTNEAMIREQYRGIRPAPGYPACPDHSEKPMLFELLDATAATGITLTDSFAMLPTAAVSGFYFGHPQAEYFGVARVGPDQLHEYATRRGVDLATATRWLRPNLD